MQLPFSFGKYELIEFLGGGMSQVYRGRDTVIDRPVVVKILTVEASSDPASKARFLQEARVAGNMQHENIVSVFDFGEHDFGDNHIGENQLGEKQGRPFLVMEYLKGVDLRVALREDTLRRGAGGGLTACLKVALQIATALEYVHQMGVVHRDIKPENINLDPSGRVKLMDFGIAKTANLSLTSTGMAMGTPYYMAPEQISGRPATPLVDIYAWGMLLFELLTGLRGVTGDTMESVFYQILHQPLDEPAMEKAGVAAEIRTLVMEATAKDAQARPQNFGIIITRLRNFLNAQEAGQTGEPVSVSATALLSAVPSDAGVAAPAAAPAAASPAVGRAPARVQQSPAGPIIRLSAIIYGLVAVTAVSAVATWFWMGRPTPSNKSSGQPSTAYVKAMAQRMVFIPAGTFLAGADKHPVMLNGFLIDTTEVTAGDYCDLMPCDKTPAQPDLPIVNISVVQARHYAMRVGKRLPTPLEWERAARGVKGNLYPWGDAEDPTLANVADNPSFGGRQLVPVKSFQAYPEYQMVGNAWEFVEGRVTPSEEAVRRFASLGKLNPPPTASEAWVSARGGSYAQPLAPNIVYDALAIPERFTAPDIGFRCVKDP